MIWFPILNLRLLNETTSPHTHLPICYKHLEASPLKQAGAAAGWAAASVLLPRRLASAVPAAAGAAADADAAAGAAADADAAADATQFPTGATCLHMPHNV